MKKHGMECETCSPGSFFASPVLGAKEKQPRYMALEKKNRRKPEFILVHGLM